MRQRTVARYPSTGSQLAFARAATALAVMSIGALALAAVAVGRMVIRSLRIKNGRIEHLSIDELEVRRLRAQELITGPNSSSGSLTEDVPQRSTAVPPQTSSEVTTESDIPASGLTPPPPVPPPVPPRDSLS